MEQFSHDLTLALEETSKCGTRIGRWGMRRRTRSTGNLPCAPQPTEDSSSSITDPPNDSKDSNNQTCLNDRKQCDKTLIGITPFNLLSDSDDHFQLTLQHRQRPLIGNFESDSFNENFSPSRPNTRRKRKFKRMAVEYETTPSTPSNMTASGLFPVSGTVKKRVLKHGQENYKSNVFFCGKRKRSHRDRYYDYERQHPNSVPRQRDVFLPSKAGSSYLEHKTRNRTNTLKPCERIMPLTKSIVSKIEKISQETKFQHQHQNHKIGFEFAPLTESKPLNIQPPSLHQLSSQNILKSENILRQQQQQQATAAIIQYPADQSTRVAHKSGSFESTFIFDTYGNVMQRGKHRKHKSSRRHDMMQLQFEDPSYMDCGQNEFSSSSSLSSDSEEIETNESDREGDDELTDWPGNEVMVNVASKQDFKKARTKTKTNLPQIKSEDGVQDDDTLMSGDDLILTPLEHFETSSIPQLLSDSNCSTIFNSSSSSVIAPPRKLTDTTTIRNLIVTASGGVGIGGKMLAGKNSLPIDITATNKLHELSKQIESEMSGETSNHFYSSPNSTSTYEQREIRAGCRRIREERPGFSIISSANEELSRFLQDGRQTRLRLHDIQDVEKLSELAKLYSLKLENRDGCTILTKTSNTTQFVHVEQTKLNKKFLADFKRRCYGDGDEDAAAATATVTESNEMAS